LAEYQRMGRSLRALIEAYGDLRRSLVTRLRRGVATEAGTLTAEVVAMPPSFAKWHWVERALAATQPAFMKDRLDGEYLRLLVASVKPSTMQSPTARLKTKRCPAGAENRASID